MKAGALRNRLAIQRQNGTTQDAYGEPAESWATVAHRWAAVVPLSGREILAADKTKADVTHKIVMRWPQTLKITHDMRFVCGNRVFHPIEPPRNIEQRGRTLEVLCREEG